MHHAHAAPRHEVQGNCESRIPSTLRAQLFTVRGDDAAVIEQFPGKRFQRSIFGESEANDNTAWDLGIRTTIPLSSKAISQNSQPAVLTLLMHTVVG